MRIGGSKTINCIFHARGFGRLEVTALAAGWGFTVAASSGEARTRRTYYPFVRTFGGWWIEMSFADAEERRVSHTWLLSYIIRMTDANRLLTLNPISVRIPSEDFHKVGYPTGSIEFGDEARRGGYTSIMRFEAAMRPDVMGDSGSQFVPASRGGMTTRRFYPGGLQSNLPAPRPEFDWSPPTNPDYPWSPNYGGGAP